MENGNTQNLENSAENQVQEEILTEFGWGGKRNRSGRKPGSLNNITKAKETMWLAFQERILNNLYDLLSSQLNLAKGASYVYRIERVKGKPDNHILIEDPNEIKEFLDEHQGGNGPMEEGGDYYYITTKAPENKALDSLIDRIFGKAPLELKHSGGITHQITGMKIIKEPNETNRIPEQKSETNISS